MGGFNSIRTRIGQCVMLLFVLVAISLTGCSDLSGEEAQLAGRWEWHKTKGHNSEKGYLILNDDRTYQYKIESNIRLEGLAEISDGMYGVWHLVDKNLCFHPTGNEESRRCVFTDVEVDGQRLRFELDGFFKMGRLEAVRKSE